MYSSTPSKLFGDETLATAELEGGGAVIWRRAGARRAAEGTNAVYLIILSFAGDRWQK